MSPTIASSSPHQAILAGTFRVAKHVVSTRHADSVILLDADRGLYYTLNELGGCIWDQLKTGESARDIVRVLQQRYDVTTDTLEADVARLLDSLLHQALIEWIER